MKSPFKVKNIENGIYFDADMMAFHAFFTCLCYYVEEEHEGIEKFEKYCQMCVEGAEKDWDKYPVIKHHRRTMSTHMEEMCGANKKTLELYKWYTDTDWDKYPWNDSDGLEFLTLRIKEAADVMWSWWT